MENLLAEIPLTVKAAPSETEKNILSCLAYFSVFGYPLTENEIREYIHFKSCEGDEFYSAIKNLEKEEIIRFDGRFYSLAIDEDFSERRKNGNALAEVCWHKAKKYSAVISGFPFVRAVFISGSLSKNFMDQNSDIDYFIVTHPGRLWLCRTLLALYKKIFLLNSRKYFCINYFVDTSNLAIPERNLFTATELLTLATMMNRNMYAEIIKLNSWTREFLPGKIASNFSSVENVQASALKKITEKFLSGLPGSLLDNFCLWITLRFWKIKFRNKNADWFDNELRSTKYVSKHHPNSFGKKVKEKYFEKLRELDLKYDFTLAEEIRFN